jgi:antitoxin (DNA-binding transcriptional repressor) of toxin-antitoxin stability system
MSAITLADAKIHLSKLVDRVEAGDSISVAAELLARPVMDSVTTGVRF